LNIKPLWVNFSRPRHMHCSRRELNRLARRPFCRAHRAGVLAILARPVFFRFASAALYRVARPNHGKATHFSFPGLDAGGEETACQEDFAQRRWRPAALLSIHAKGVSAQRRWRPAALLRPPDAPRSVRFTPAGTAWPSGPRLGRRGSSSTEAIPALLQRAHIAAPGLPLYTSTREIR
jgi:hypothetical protein